MVRCDLTFLSLEIRIKYEKKRKVKEVAHRAVTNVRTNEFFEPVPLAIQPKLLTVLKNVYHSHSHSETQIQNFRQFK